MKRCIKEALSRESYSIPSFADVHARYHFRSDVLASCWPPQVAWRKPSCRDVRSGTCSALPECELSRHRTIDKRQGIQWHVKIVEADLFLDSLSLTSGHDRREAAQGGWQRA